MKKSILIYGTGKWFLELQKIIRWDNIIMFGFLESVPSKNEFWGYEVYSVDKISSMEFDYILVATTEYEIEIRMTLLNLGVENKKIISGILNDENILINTFLFNHMNYIIWKSSKILDNVRFTNERNLFWDLAKGISWINPKMSLSPGGMAVGYDYLYVLCRILQILQPKSILEIGLGQSSKLLLNYYNNHSCTYDIIEQSKDWYEFFQVENDVPSGVNVHIRPMITKYSDIYNSEINCFSEIETIVRNKKFSLISIDGPWGSDGVSRTDLLPYIPDCLENNFVILLDDYNRIGEKEMVRLLEDNMIENNIKFLKKVYGNKKQFCLITSSNNPFLCSLYSPIN